MTRIKAIIDRARHSADIQDSMVMSIAMVLAGGFDYLTNLISGRWLAPEQFSIFVTVSAILQILLYATNVIRNVVAYYVADLSSREDQEGVSLFFGRMWRWAWRYGLASTALFALLSIPLARWLNFGTPLPLWAAALALLLLFLRPVTDGTLQGNQAFWALSAVQLGQALIRLGFTVVLLLVGWQAFGALLALPLATSAACILALWYLRDVQAATATGQHPTEVSWRYSLFTLVGLVAYALLVNMDAIFVRAAFSAELSGDYGPVVTLGKINLFLPLGLGMALFPKVIERQQNNQNPVPLLLLTLGAVSATGLTLTLLYFWIPGQLVGVIFGTDYANPGRLLGYVGLATTLFAATNLWLQFALAQKRSLYVILLAVIVGAQALLFWLYGTTLVAVGFILAGTGLAANLAGVGLLLRQNGG